MKKILVIIWDDGKKEEYIYNSYEEAEQAKINIEKAFGKQVYCYIR